MAIIAATIMTTAMVIATATTNEKNVNVAQCNDII